MNPSTVLGIIAGILIVGLSIALTAEKPSVFVNLPGLSVVLGGTLAATLLAYPMKEVFNVFGTLVVVLKNERLYSEEDQKELVRIARHLIKGDMQATEKALEGLKNPFLKSGVQMVVDNTPDNELVELLEWRIFKLKAREAAEAQIYHTMASFAPAFGMLGTLIGLVNMLYGMGGAGMESIGVNMGLALLTTLYGVALANLLFKPIAIKFERRTEERVMLMNTIMEGVLLLSRGHTPAYIREFLAIFLEHNVDELRSHDPVPPTAEAE